MCAEHGQLRASCKAAPLEGELVAATFYGFRVWGLGYGSKGLYRSFIGIMEENGNYYLGFRG